MKSFKTHIFEQDELNELNEAFNSPAYELTFGKKSAGDIFFTFHDESEKEYRIQFYTPAGLGKNVRQVFIGQKKGSVYPDVIQKFANPMKVIATMIEAMKQFMETPIGRGIDGFAVNFSKKALERGMAIIPKIIRKSGLKQKLNVMDLTFAPVPDRGYVWVIRKGKDPAQVFDGPKMVGVTWDDPDKVGDTPPAAAAIPPLTQHMTSQDMDAHPFRRQVLANIDKMIQSEGIAVSGGSKGYYKFTGGGSFRVFFDQVRGNSVDGLKFDGSVATKDGTFKIQTAFDVDEATKAFMDVIRAQAPQAAGDSYDYTWKYQPPKARDQQPQMIYVITKGRNTYTAMVAPHVRENGIYVLNDSDHKSSKGPSAALLINSILPSPPVALYNQFIKDSQAFWDYNIKPDGWMNDTAPAGNPSIACYKNGVIQGGIGLRFSPIYGVYSGASTAAKFKEIEGTDLNVLSKQLKLPTVPADVADKFTAAAIAWWKSKNVRPIQPQGAGASIDLSDLKIPKGGKLHKDYSASNKGTVVWDTQFKKSDDGAQFYSFQTHISVDAVSASIIEVIMFKGNAINAPKAFALRVQGLNAVAVIDQYLADRAETLKRFTWAVATLADPDHNKTMVALPDPKFTSDGSILIQGRSIKGMTSSEIVGVGLGLERAADAAAAAGVKAAAKLAADRKANPEAEIVRVLNTMASGGREIDWQIYARGNTYYAHWNITFRRNTQVGAYKQYQGEIRAGNAALERMKAYLESLGLKVKSLMPTLDDAKSSDEMAENNGDGAYSEYEQSIDGSLEATK